MEYENMILLEGMSCLPPSIRVTPFEFLEKQETVDNKTRIK